jgi:hypothetical protein
MTLAIEPEALAEWPEWDVAATALLKIVEHTKATNGACSKSVNPDSHPEVRF